MNPKYIWVTLLLILAQCTGVPAYCDTLLLKAVLTDYDKYPHTNDLIRLLPIQMPEPPCDHCTPQAVNEFYNIFPYLAEGPTDDHWKTVQEFWKDGGGDCEDFAIAKYHALKDKYDVKILVAIHQARGRTYGHAVVLLDGVYILDINPPYFYTYRQFIDYWTPLETYDAKGVQHVIVPEEGEE